MNPYLQYPNFDIQNQEESKSAISLPAPKFTQVPPYGAIKQSKSTKPQITMINQSSQSVINPQTKDRAIFSETQKKHQSQENQSAISLYESYTSKSLQSVQCQDQEKKNNNDQDIGIDPTVRNFNSTVQFYDTTVLIFKVVEVNIKSNSSKTLKVICPSAFPNKIFHVILKGIIWGQTLVQMGSYVRILAKFQDQTEDYPNPWVIIQGPPHDQYFLILEPLLLLPPTSIIKMVSCARKPFLDKNFVDVQQSTTVPYIKGIIVHQLFQQLIHIKFNQRRHPRPQDYKQCIDRLIDQFRDKIASLIEIREQDLRDQATRAVDFILQWIARPEKDLKIKRVVAIEQDYSSQRFGIRAKIDATISVINQKGQEQVAALELKSGKYQTDQYRGQVQFYALLILQKYQFKSSMNHWLVYILNKNTNKIKYDYWQAATLIKLRNKMAFTQRNFEQKFSVSNIPECVDQKHKRECKGCQTKPLCSLVYSSFERGLDRPIPGIPQEFRKNNELISQHTKQYMQKWMKLIGWKECVTTNPVAKYAHSKYQFKWEKQSPFTTQSLTSLNLSESANPNANSSTQSKSFYKQIILRKIAKGYRVEGQVQLDEQVSLQGNSVPMTIIKGAIVIDISEGNERIVVKCDYQQIQRAKIKLSQTEGQQISDVKLNSYRWCIVPIGRGSNQFFSSSDFAKMRGAVANFCLKPNDHLPQQTIIEGNLPPLDSTDSTTLLNSLKANFQQQFELNLSPAQQNVVRKIIQGPSMTLIDTAVGCGKSVVIAFLIKLFHSVGKSVLLTGNSLNEIDHILQTMIRNLQPNYQVPFVRIGNKKMLSAPLLPYSPPEQFKQEKEVEEFLKNKRIFTAIIKDIGNIIFEIAGTKQFDYVIVLGAQSISEPRSLLPISKGKQVILVGDQISLRLKKKPKSFDAIEFEQSLYTRLAQSFEKCIVEPFFNQFELNKELLQFFNLAFYDQKLYHSKNVPKEILNSEFRPYPIQLDLDQDENEFDQNKSSKSNNTKSSKKEKSITELVFGQNSPAICLIDIQDNSNITSTSQKKLDSFQIKEQQQIQASLIDKMLTEIKSQEVINIRQQIHLFSPVASNIRYLRNHVKSYVSISNVDEYLRFRPKDCVILSVGIGNLSNIAAFSPCTLPAMMRGKSKLVIVSKMRVLEKIKGFTSLVQYFKVRKSTHVFNH